MSAPLVSLAVIVKDQAAMLRRLLDEHRALYDEAVVVDTGSRDASAAAALAAGARVAVEPWRDDFSRARNAALDLCRGRWIVVLDCDEAVTAADQRRLRALLAAGPAAGLALTQWNYSDAAGAVDWRPVSPAEEALARGARGLVPVRSVRAFPNRPDVRYAGVVHETVEAALAAAGLACRPTDVVVHHHGHLGNPAAQHLRRQRNLRLLRRKIALAPQDPRARRELAEHLVQAGRHDLAVRLLTRAVREHPHSEETPAARRLLARLFVAQGRMEEARAQAMAALVARPDHAGAWQDAVRIGRLAGTGVQAERLLRQARWLFPLDVQLQVLASQEIGRRVDNENRPARRPAQASCLHSEQPADWRSDEASAETRQRRSHTRQVQHGHG